MKEFIKIKYLVAVVMCIIATAFSSCASDNNAEIIPLSEYDDEVLNEGKEDLIDSDVNEAKANENIYVYVCGAVAKPGVYELDQNARVVDAINAAGNANLDAAREYLNLASTLKDGEKVYVPTYKEIEEVISEGYEYTGNSLSITSKGRLIEGKSSENGVSISDNSSQNSAIGTSCVNINTADESTLMTIPGIGQSKASKIIKYREENGGFSCIEDIMLISGIKEGMFNRIKDYICVE